MRIKCAVLAWDVLQEALGEAEGGSTEGNRAEVTGEAAHLG